jgi:hypothetical protein
MTSAAIYARVSSARQKKDYTIGPQTAVCWEWMAITPAELPTVLGRGSLASSPAASHCSVLGRQEVGDLPRRRWQLPPASTTSGGCS